MKKKNELYSYRGKIIICFIVLIISSFFTVYGGMQFLARADRIIEAERVEILEIENTALAYLVSKYREIVPFSDLIEVTKLDKLELELLRERARVIRIRLEKKILKEEVEREKREKE